MTPILRTCSQNRTGRAGDGQQLLKVLVIHTRTFDNERFTTMVISAQSLEHILTSVVGTRSPETWAGPTGRENALPSRETY